MSLYTTAAPLGGGVSVGVAVAVWPTVGVLLGAGVLVGRGLGVLLGTGVLVGRGLGVLLGTGVLVGRGVGVRVGGEWRWAARLACASLSATWTALRWAVGRRSPGA